MTSPVAESSVCSALAGVEGGRTVAACGLTATVACVDRSPRAEFVVCVVADIPEEVGTIAGSAILFSDAN